MCILNSNVIDVTHIPKKKKWRGCASVVSNSTHTVCSCSHLSSFALLKDINQMPLSVVMSVGLSVATVCLVLSLLVTQWCLSVYRKLNERRLQQQELH